MTDHAELTKLLQKLISISSISPMVFLSNGTWLNAGIKNCFFVDKTPSVCFCTLDEKYKTKPKTALKEIFYEW